ncbi:MAG: hypothetical protein ACH36H_12480, partial [Candidatus Nanopelagicales bacterium]
MSSRPAGGPAPRDPAWRDVLAAAIAAVFWLTAFAVRLAQVPTAWWAWRDDAVITMRHGLNWVQSGAVGVSLGDRSEGSSSPLGVLVSAAVLGVRNVGYEACSIGVFIVSMLIAAAATTVLLTHLGQRMGLPARAAVVRSTLLSCAVGAVVACSWTAAGWIASGMENALVVALAFA